MNPSVVLLLAALFALVGCEQPSRSRSADALPPSGSNRPAPATEDGRINIPGTRLFMIPPARFTISRNAVGLERGETAAIQVMDLVGGSFEKNAATFSRQEFEARGVTVFDYAETTVDGFPAKYVYMQADPTMKVCNLVFGDTTFSAMVTAILPPDDDSLTQQVKKSLLTITYNKRLRVDPFATAPFLLDDTKAEFKFSRFSGNMYLYTPTGADETKGTNDAIVMVMPLPREADATPTTIAETTSASREKYGLTDKVVKNESIERVNGYEAHEAEIYGSQKGKPALFYELILVNDTQSLMVQGIISTDFQNSLKKVRAFAHTIRFK